MKTLSAANIGGKDCEFSGMRMIGRSGCCGDFGGGLLRGEVRELLFFREWSLDLTLDGCCFLSLIGSVLC
jgi:hypothetical protein